MQNVQQMESIIDQLRIHDGKLFQNESVLAVYVDFKRLVLDNVLLALQMPGGLSGLMDWNDKLEQELVASLTTAESNLQECLEQYATELHKTANPIPAGGMLKHMMAKLCSDPSVVSKQILSLDPIKQDFVCREIFRRCLFLYLTDTPKTATLAAIASVDVNLDTVDTSDKAERDTVAELDVNVRPEDSASQVLPPKSVVSVAPAQLPQPPPASVVKSVVKSVAKQSEVSTFSQKRPAIRRVVIEDDATTVFSRRQ
jgi:hypothetical protein